MSTIQDSINAKKHLTISNEPGATTRAETLSKDIKTPVVASRLQAFKSTQPERQRTGSTRIRPSYKHKSFSEEEMQMQIGLTTYESGKPPSEIAE